MLPLAELFPHGFLDRCRVRNRFTLETELPHCITVFFQNHLPRSGSFAENATYVEGAANPARDIDRGRLFGMTYVLAGRARLVDRQLGSFRTIAAGDLACFNQVALNQVHVRPDPGFLEVGLVLDGGLGQRLLDQGLWPGPWVTAAVGDSVALVQALHELYEALPDLELGHRSLFWRVLRICALAQELAESSGSDAGFASRARRVLSDHPEPGFTVADAAAALQMPETRFRRRFTAEVGISPGAWQLRQRMQRAADLLVEHPVHRVAQVLGYRDPALFSRQFRNAMGIPPSAMRQRGRSDG